MKRSKNKKRIKNIKRTKRTGVNTKCRNDVKKVLWVMALTGLIGFYSSHFNPVYGSINDFTQNNVLPQTGEKEFKTDKEKIIYYSLVECQKRGMGEACALDIQGMAYTESRFNCKAIGDAGKSKGCLQIHQGFHPHITQEQAEDPQFAISWTLNRMTNYGYPEYRSRAIRKHNGSPTNPATLSYLQKVNNYINN